MANIKNYRTQKQDMLIALSIQGLVFFGVIVLMIIGGDHAVLLPMIMIPTLVISYVQYTALDTKIELLKELQDIKDAYGIAEVKPDKKALP